MSRNMSFFLWMLKNSDSRNVIFHENSFPFKDIKLNDIVLSSTIELFYSFVSVTFSSYQPDDVHLDEDLIDNNEHLASSSFDAQIELDNLITTFDMNNFHPQKRFRQFT